MVDGSLANERLEAEIERLRSRVSELESLHRDSCGSDKIQKDQLHFLQTLIDTIPNPIFYKGTKGLYLGCNKAFELRMGRTKGEIVGKSAFDLFPADLAARYDQHDLEIFARPCEKSFETEIVWADGTRRHVIITKGIFTDSEGNVSGLVGVTHDITDRKVAEGLLQKAHDDLERRVEERTAALARANLELKMQVSERNRITEELRASSEKMKIFAYSVAHDLKSPSVGIYGLARLLRSRYGPMLGDKGEACCDQIMKASEHVASLVDAINMFIAAKETPLKLERVEMEEVFRMLADEFSTRLRVRQVCFTVPERGVLIRADKMSMLRIFRNLIDNAIKYGGETLAHISICYSEAADFHHFTVADDGVGIKGEDAGRIFNLFQRRETASGVEGTGLGLAIVKEIVELHKGEVWVEGGKEGGTVFHVLISKDL